MMRPLLIAGTLAAVASPLPAISEGHAAQIQYPVAIPSGCFELAQREGYPTVINNRWEAAKARMKLASMRNSDPLVRQCREAVSEAVVRYRAAARFESPQ